MNYGDLKADLIDHLNRTDITDAQAGRFIRQAQSRLERVLRIPTMQRVISTTVTAGSTQGYILVPSDFLELSELSVDDTILERVALRQLRATAYPEGNPRVYTPVADRWMIAGEATGGQTIEALYYGTFALMTNDTDENDLAAFAPDLLVYGAAVLAGDRYESDDRDRWKATYQELLNEVLEQDMRQDATGGPMSISPAYTE